MSCPDRTLVTKVRGHPSGNQRRPTRGDSRSFHCHRGVRPRPAALRVPPRWPAFSGVPESPFPPPGSLLSPCPPTSFPLAIPCLHLHSHRCPFIPRSVPRHHFCTSATWTPNRTVLGHTPTCLSNHATPVSVVAVDAWPLGLALTSPASSETVGVSKCVRPSVKVGPCVCLCLSLHEVVRLRVSVSTGFCPSVCHVGVCSAAAGLWVASVTARLSSVGVWHWSASGPRGLRVSAPREGERGEVAARGSREGRGRRQWAGAGGGAVQPAGGVCGGPEAAAVRVGSACAGEHRPPPAPGAARPGPAWPPQVSLPPRPGHSFRPASGAPCAPRGVQAPLTGRLPRRRACPAPPSAAPHSSGTLPRLLHTHRRPRRSPSPRGPPPPLRSDSRGDPRAPFPRSLPSPGPLEDTS